MNFFESSMNKMNLIFIHHEESYSNTNHNTMLQQKKTSIAKVSHYRRHLSLKHSSIKKRRVNTVIHVAIRLPKTVPSTTNNWHTVKLMKNFVSYKNSTLSYFPIIEDYKK